MNSSFYILCHERKLEICELLKAAFVNSRMAKETYDYDKRCAYYNQKDLLLQQAVDKALQLRKYSKSILGLKRNCERVPFAGGFECLQIIYFSFGGRKYNQASFHIRNEFEALKQIPILKGTWSKVRNTDQSLGREIKRLRKILGKA